MSPSFFICKMGAAVLPQSHNKDSEGKGRKLGHGPGRGFHPSLSL